MKRAVLALAVALFPTLDAAGRAPENGFERRDQGGVTKLSYTFRDLNGETRRIAFSLPTNKVAKADGDFKRFDNKAVSERHRAAYLETLGVEMRALKRRYPGLDVRISRSGDISYTLSPTAADQPVQDAGRAVMEAAAAALTRDYPRVTFSVVDQGSQTAFSANGPMSPEEHRAIQRRISDATRRAEAASKRENRSARRAFDSRFASIEAEVESAIVDAQKRAEAASTRSILAQGYREIGDGAVIPDYGRIARRGAKDLDSAIPAFRRLVHGVDRREGLNRLLAFFQRIPYDTLTSRWRASTDAGFAHPITLLAGNKGDCDTKSVAFASVAHRLWPDMRIAMVLLDDHALLALDLPVRQGDRGVRYDGQRWVLAEPVGPGEARLGQIGHMSAKGVRGEFKMLEMF